MERNVKIVIGVIACLIGICFICSNYYLSLKHEVFDDMNKLYYEQKVAINEELSEIVAEGNDDESSENEVVTEPVHNEEENNNNEPPLPQLNGDSTSFSCYDGWYKMGSYFYKPQSRYTPHWQS